MKVGKIKLKNRSKRIHFRGIRFPLCRVTSVQLMVRELVGTQSSPDGLFQALRRSLSVRRNTRFHRVIEYNKLGPAILEEHSRRYTLAHRAPKRLVLARSSSKKGI